MNHESGSELVHLQHLSFMRILDLDNAIPEHFDTVINSHSNAAILPSSVGNKWPETL